MALFTDGGCVAAADLLPYEASVLDTMRREGVGIEPKLVLAQRIVGQQVTPLLAMESGVDAGGEALRHVVVDDSLRHWVAVTALELLFADAYTQQLSDRFKAKREQYQAMAAEARRACLAAGVGLVYRPVPKAERPLLRVEAGSGPAVEGLVQVSWCRGGQEGAPSEPMALSAGAGQRLVLAARAPHGVTGWHVYAGTEAGRLQRQTVHLIAPDDEWFWPAELSVGPLAGSGQQAEQVVRDRHRIWRG